ncbi:heme biosynthesis HemY N-terminal domain-containing protein [Sinimarinibacterium sp. NLF-5-8]|uniref:heme biosynthesis HemY N-terminal domain-containing protein n=1 Tax=Sinimarinibacterium sp. NLF-5-8 TaxID=2698684 RepID=UPI00137C32DE|nr:heme biosynthesis HemY N-terminal domain-containing protein [Sinimarinibacterium sp. NLF-5-8]QHS10352.1 hypothetical protein GT972_09535 [Sinimarinibacterium sp. NLF-5-8]
MIRFLILALLILALGAASAWFLHGEAGYVLVSLRGWQLETSALGLIIALVLLVILVGTLLRLISGSLRLPRTMRQNVIRHRQQRAQKSLEQGLQNWLEGSWQKAEMDLVRRAADHDTPELSYLLAARAAQRIGADERRNQYLGFALDHPSALQRTGHLTQAALQIERAEYEAGLATLARLDAKAARLPHAIELTADALRGAGRWDELRKMLLSDDGKAALSQTRHHALLEQATLESLRAAEASAQLEQLKAVWVQTPADVCKWPNLRRQYARSLARLNARSEALALASEALAQDWDPQLAALYGELTPANAVGQLAMIEEWLSRYGEWPELLLAAGRACLRNQLWGKAQSYLDALVRNHPSPAAYLELARLNEQTQKPDQAQAFYRKGLELAASQQASDLPQGSA